MAPGQSEAFIPSRPDDSTSFNGGSSRGSCKRHRGPPCYRTLTFGDSRLLAKAGQPPRYASALGESEAEQRPHWLIAHHG
jgi:hypothetical protein